MRTTTGLAGKLWLMTTGLIDTIRFIIFAAMEKSKSKNRKGKYDEVFTISTSFEDTIKKMVSPEVIAANMAKKKEKKALVHK